MDENYIVLSIPSGAVEVEINAKVYYGDDLMDVTKHLDIEQIRQAVKEAEDWYIPDDARFELTDKGREYIDKCLMEGWNE